FASKADEIQVAADTLTNGEVIKARAANIEPVAVPLNGGSSPFESDRVGGLKTRLEIHRTVSRHFVEQHHILAPHHDEVPHAEVQEPRVDRLDVGCEVMESFTGTKAQVSATRPRAFSSCYSLANPVDQNGGLVCA